MEHRIFRSVITFLLTLVLTIGVISVLSMATAAKTETAPARYSQEVRENQEPPVTELSAPVQEETVSPFLSIGAFVLVLGGLGTGVFLLARFGGKSGKKAAQPEKRRYSPRADMTFRNTATVRTRV